MKHTIYRADEVAPTILRLGLSPAETAESLGWSQKHLWSMTVPRGTLPAVKIGSRVTYFPHQICKWADEELTRQQAPVQQAGEVQEGGAE